MRLGVHIWICRLYHKIVLIYFIGTKMVTERYQSDKLQNMSMQGSWQTLWWSGLAHSRTSAGHVFLFWIYRRSSGPNFLLYTAPWHTLLTLRLFGTVSLRTELCICTTPIASPCAIVQQWIPDTPWFRLHFDIPKPGTRLYYVNTP